MDKKRFITLILVFFSFLIIISVISCSNKTNKSQKSAKISLILSKKNENFKETDSFRSKTKNKILVVLGENYHNEQILKPLFSEYGTETTSEAVFVKTYPDDFKYEGIARISMLADFVNEYSANILVSIGIPENSMNALSRTKTNNENIYIVSLFPYEKSLVMEAVSNLVIEPKIDNTMFAEETSIDISEEELGLLLLASVIASTPMQKETNENYTPATPNPSENCKLVQNSFELAKQKAGIKNLDKKWVFSSFIDTNTSLKSCNHLVFERINIED